MALVQFLKGTAAEYTALAAKDSNVFYHTTDDNQVYLGDIHLNGGKLTIDTTATTAGMSKTYDFKVDGTSIGKVDIPKDMVVSQGEVVTLDSAAATTAGLASAGTYIVLTIANATQDKLYINVGDLVDTYTAQASATQVQLAIDSNNEISATIVAKSITATELADGAVTTDKIVDKNVTKAKLEQSVQDAIDAMTWKTIATS